MTYILTDAEQTVVTLHPEKDGTPIAVTGVRFESSDVQVATVIQDVNNPLHAAVTEVGPGTCRITARADGITPEVLNVEVLADGRGIKLNLRVGVAEPVTPIDPPPASGASMSGLRNPWAPSITDANGVTRRVARAGARPC
jgi:hypothetical protein